MDGTQQRNNAECRCWIARALEIEYEVFAAVEILSTVVEEEEQQHGGEGELSAKDARSALRLLLTTVVPALRSAICIRGVTATASGSSGSVGLAPSILGARAIT